MSVSFRLALVSACVSVFIGLAAGGCGGCARGGEGAGAQRIDPAWRDGTLPPSITEGTPTRGGTLVVRLPSEPAMLNRLHDSGQDAWGQRILMGHVLETLLRTDPDDSAGPPLPHLAERFERSEDGLVTTFHLRRDVRFHDGTPFTSEDAAAVLAAVRDPAKPTANMRALFPDLLEVETPDPHTLVVRWRAASATGFRNLALHLPMVPSETLSGDLDASAANRAPVGTGPFRFERWDSGSRIVFARFDGHWRAPPHLDRIEFRIAKDEAVALQRFERGEFDLMTLVPPSVWRALEADDPKTRWAQRGYHRVRTAENAYNFIGWNLRREPFDDVRVRRALTHLLPDAQVERGLLFGLEPITTCPYFTGGPDCDPSLEADESPQRLRHDPARARQLLEEAGFRDTDGDGVRDRDGKPLRFSLLVWTHSVLLGRLAPLLQEELARAGIQMDIDRVEWAVFMQRVRQRDFDAISLGWSTPGADTDTFATFHSSQAAAGRNYVGLEDAQLDGLLEDRRRTFDEARRTELSRRIHARVYELQPYTFLNARSALDMVKRRVRGLRPSVSWYRLESVWLEPES